MKRGRFSQTATVAEAKRSKGSAKTNGLAIPAGQPEMPRDLSPIAQAEWDRIAGGLVDEDRLSKPDRWLLASYCETWALWRRSMAAIRRSVDTPGIRLWGFDANKKPLINADCVVFFDLSASIIDQSTTFGMTARTRHLDHHDNGRPKLPIEQHLLRGDPSRLMKGRNRREAEEALKQQRVAAEVADKSPPDGMPTEAAEEWQTMVEQLVAHGLYCPLDRASLAVGCVSWSVFRAAEKQMREQPMTLPSGDSGRNVKHPLLMVMGESWGLVNIVAREFAMAPLWRKRWKSSFIPKNIPSHLRVFMGSRSTG